MMDEQPNQRQVVGPAQAPSIARIRSSPTRAEGGGWLSGHALGGLFEVGTTNPGTLGPVADGWGETED
jgi:hypothetical protein